MWICTWVCFHSPDAFAATTSYSGNYVDGVSIYGTPLIFGVAGWSEDVENTLVCPCNIGVSNTVPSYVGSEYYCESVFQVVLDNQLRWYTDDPLWDGSVSS